MEEATYLAVGLIVLEILWRIYECPNITFEYIQTTGFEPFLWWIVAYLLCIGMVLLEVKNLPFFQSKFVRNSIKILHALDGLIALVVGMAYYYENNTLLAIGILCITKFFLLHLLSRMVTGVKAFSKWSVIVQTTKTFIHHTASFYFLAAGLSVERLSNTILLTALWRSISMTGHAVLALRAQTADDGWEGFTLTEKTYDRWTWNISHLRNAMIVVVLVSCYYDHHIRRGFGTLSLSFFFIFADEDCFRSFSFVGGWSRCIHGRESNPCFSDSITILP